MSATPLAQLDGVVILTESISLTLTSTSASCSTAEVLGEHGNDREIAARISVSIDDDLTIFLCIFSL